MSLKKDLTKKKKKSLINHKLVALGQTDRQSDKLASGCTAEAVAVHAVSVIGGEPAWHGTDHCRRDERERHEPPLALHAQLPGTLCQILAAPGGFAEAVLAHRSSQHGDHHR